MKNILTIAKWEILRLRSRFQGKSGIFILPVMLLALALSYSIYHQDFTTCKGFYTIGIASNGPTIIDPRFNVATLDEKPGMEALYKQGTIDAYIIGDRVFVRRDLRSQYTAGALKKILEKEELSRISAQYPVDRAFPLRIEIAYLNTDSSSSQGSIAESRPEAPQSPVLPKGPVSPPPVNNSTAAPPAALAELITNDNNRPAGSSPAAYGDIPTVSPEPQDIIAPSFSSPPPVAAGKTQDAGTDAVVRQQLAESQKNQKLPEFKADFVSENEIIVPSLMSPPMPLAQVVIAFLYIIPMFFVSVFFTSSFTEEKVNHKLVILLSAPVSQLQIILGKMLPYWGYSLLVISAVTVFLKGNLFLAWAIFIPVMLFIFSIYLIVALTYRTFKDQTFFSVLALSVITVYLVVPAMFTGVNNLSYISPLTLAVNMYRGESFGISEYLLATTPLYLTFFLAIFVGNRVFNEEYLMGFKPLRLKAVEALYLAMDGQHLNLSVFVLSLLLIPLVFAVQLLLIVLATNLPSMIGLWAAMLISVIIEELAKSAGLFVLIKKGVISRQRDILKLAILSALGFWAGEKLLLLLTLKFAAESKIISAVLGSGISNIWLLVVPLILHAVSTYLVCGITAHRNRRGYLLGIIAGVAVHAAYNLCIMLVSGVVR
jgi:hypothetical protein